MSTRARKVPDLVSTNTVSTTDLFIIEQVSGANSTTKSISGGNLRKAMARGPYANDSVANTNSIAVGEMYYTAAGDVKVRIS